jgi:hypothetical protein
VKTTLLLLVPADVVTATKYVVPTVTSGEIAVIVVELVTTTFVAGTLTAGLVAVPPDSSTKVTVAPVKKPVPVITSEVPPGGNPTGGAMLLTTGNGSRYLKTALLVLVLVPVGVVTVTKYVVPTMTAGVTAVIVVSDETSTLVAGSVTVGLTSEFPFSSVKFTEAPVTNPIPEIVTAVPPEVGPCVGLVAPNPLTVGTTGV